jgi:hypothetical protein
MAVRTSEPSRELSLAHARLAALEAENAALTSKLSAVASERDTLRTAYTALKHELELLKRRLFIAKAERVDVAQLELEFAAKLAELDALSKRLEPVPEELLPATPPAPPKREKKPKGRRDLRAFELPEESVVVLDDTLEGKVPRSGVEVSYKLETIPRRRGKVIAPAKIDSHLWSPWSARAVSDRRAAVSRDRLHLGVPAQCRIVVPRFREIVSRHGDWMMRFERNAKGRFSSLNLSLGDETLGGLETALVSFESDQLESLHVSVLLGRGPTWRQSAREMIERAVKQQKRLRTLSFEIDKPVKLPPKPTVSTGS